jgi:hypothetical protein
MATQKVAEKRKITAARTVRRVKIATLLATGIALAISPISDASAYAARQSPLVDSSYSWAVPAQKKASSKGKVHHIKKPAKVKAVKKAVKYQAIKPQTAIAPADVLSVHAEKAKAHQTALKAHPSKANTAAKKKMHMHWYNLSLELVGAATVGYGFANAVMWLVYRVPLAIAFSRRKCGDAKAKLREKLARIRMRFQENIALIRARRIVESMSKPRRRNPPAKPKLTLKDVSEAALKRAKKVRSKKARKAFLMMVEKALSVAFSQYEQDMRLLHIAINSI